MIKVPIFDTVREACQTTGATASAFLCRRPCSDAILEGVEAGLELVVCITEGIPFGI